MRLIRKGEDEQDRKEHKEGIMSLEIIGWLIFGGGIVVGVLIAGFFASLKISGLRKLINLKDIRIKLLQDQLEIASKGEEK